MNNVSSLTTLPTQEATPSEILTAIASGCDFIKQKIGDFDAQIHKEQGENTYLKLELHKAVQNNESLYAENEVLTEKIRKFEESAQLILENAKKSEQMLAQAATERDQAINKTNDQAIQLKAFKEIESSPKKIRDKIKAYQDRITKQTKAAEQHKRNFLSERKTTTELHKRIKDLDNRLDAASINQIYRNEADIITMFPYRLGDAVHGFQAEQVPLLYMHHSGRGGLILLNEHGEAQLVEAPKGGLRPKKATMEHCGQLLRRFKEKNWELDANDIESLTHNSQ